MSKYQDLNLLQALVECDLSKLQGDDCDEYITSWVKSHNNLCTSEDFDSEDYDSVNKIKYETDYEERGLYNKFIKDMLSDKSTIEYVTFNELHLSIETFNIEIFKNSLDKFIENGYEIPEVVLYKVLYDYLFYMKSKKSDEHDDSKMLLKAMLRSIIDKQAFEEDSSNYDIIVDEYNIFKMSHYKFIKYILNKNYEKTEKYYDSAKKYRTIGISCNPLMEFLCSLGYIEQVVWLIEKGEKLTYFGKRIFEILAIE